MKSALRLLALLVPAILLSPSVALAESPAKSMVSARNLLPVEYRAFSAQPEANDFDTVVDQINLSIGPGESEFETITDVIQMPLLDEILDDNGNLDLPMGITVFNTMGDFSVGFGSDF